MKHFLGGYRHSSLPKSSSGAFLSPVFTRYVPPQNPLHKGAHRISPFRRTTTRRATLPPLTEAHTAKRNLLFITFVSLYVCVKGDFEKFEAKNREKEIYAVFCHAFVRGFRVKAEPLCLQSHLRCIVSDAAFATQAFRYFSTHRRNRHGVGSAVRQGNFNLRSVTLF